MSRNTKWELAQARDGRENIQRRGWGKKPETSKTQAKARKEVESNSQSECKGYNIPEHATEIPNCWMLRKVMANLDSLLKSRDITLPTKVRLVKAVVFPVVTYGCESWTVKKAERRKLMLLNCGVGEDS